MGTFKRSFITLVSILALALTVVAGLAPQAGAVSSTERSAEQYLLGLVNADRKASHLGTIKEQSYIRGQSEAHSADMLHRQSMDHNGFSQRVANIRANDSGMRNAGICENVAVATNYADYGSAMRTIDAAWKASTGHRKCMLDQEGWSSQSGAIGVRYDGHSYWVTYEAGHDTTP